MTYVCEQVIVYRVRSLTAIDIEVARLAIVCPCFAY